MKQLTAPAVRLDFKRPDYATVFRRRLENLEELRAHPEDVPALRAY